MSNVALITLHYIRNYGSVLQTYATQKKLELMGHRVHIIDYVRENAEERAMLKDGLESKHFGKNVVKSAAYVALKKIENIKRNKVCVEFLSQNVSLTRKYKDYAIRLGIANTMEVYFLRTIWNLLQMRKSELVMRSALV